MKLARKTGESALDVVDYSIMEPSEGCRRFRTLTEQWTSRNAWKMVILIITRGLCWFQKPVMN